MIINVLEYLEESAKKYPNKVAFEDDVSSITYSQILAKAKSLACKITSLGITNSPIAIYMEKSIKCITSLLAVVYSGNFYTFLDIETPFKRLNSIFNTLQPIAVISNQSLLDKIKQAECLCEIVVFEDTDIIEVDEKKLEVIRRKAIDTDPLYILFTSGSTGVPKGVVISHKSVINYTEWVSKTFSLSETDRLGNQSPFYFDNSVLDIYTTLRNGSTMFIIPQKLFSFPVKLIEFLNEKRVNFIFWVPSSFCLIVNLRAFQALKPLYLNKILFAGEVMPNKQLNVWRKNIPNALYANLYGPTEITVDCIFYIVDRAFRDDEPLPIGKPCKNTDILIINEQNQLVKKNEIGEICVRGTSLALGYYNNPDKTREVFVQNPLNKAYNEIIYRTGDLAKYNELGEIIFLNRKDSQIKHLGYRIELGEIESAFNSLEEIDSCCCLYDLKKSNLVLFYESKKNVSELHLRTQITMLLPKYMIPTRFIKLDNLPLNKNGKIDRLKLHVMVCDSNV